MAFARYVELPLLNKWITFYRKVRYRSDKPYINNLTYNQVEEI